MRAGRVGARIAAAALLHVPEGRVVVAVGAEDEALALDPGGEVEQLEVVQRAFQFLVELDVAVLGKRESLIALETKVHIRNSRSMSTAANLGPYHAKSRSFYHSWQILLISRVQMSSSGSNYKGCKWEGLRSTEAAHLLLTHHSQV